MLLINRSVIWLLSLIVYELLLRRETYHSMNRCYLLTAYLLNRLKDILPPLSDAVYQVQISGIVLDTERRIVHYNCTGLNYNAQANGKPQNKDSKTIEPGICRATDQQIASALLNKITVRSSGKKIDNPMVLGYDLSLKFRIQNHNLLPY